MKTVSLTSVAEDAKTGAVYLRFGKIEHEFPGGWTDIEADLGRIESGEAPISLSINEALAVAYARHQSGDVKDLTAVIGKDFTFDVTDATPIKVSDKGGIAGIEVPP